MKEVSEMSLQWRVRLEKSMALIVLCRADDLCLQVWR